MRGFLIVVMLSLTSACSSLRIDEIIDAFIEESGHDYKSCYGTQCMLNALAACEPAKWIPHAGCKLITDTPRRTEEQEMVFVVPENGGCWVAQFEHHWGTSNEGHISRTQYDTLVQYACAGLTVDGTCLRAFDCENYDSWDL